MRWEAGELDFEHSTSLFALSRRYFEELYFDYIDDVCGEIKSAMSGRRSR
jgi:hypothetical protein